jgi:hypothetical protein
MTGREVIRALRACLVKVRVNLFVGLGYAEDLIVMAFFGRNASKTEEATPKTAHIRQFFLWQRSRFSFFKSNPITYQTGSNPTVTLSVIEVRSVRCSTVRVPNIGHSGASLGSQEGISGLLNGPLGLSVTVGLRTWGTKRRRG